MSDAFYELVERPVVTDEMMLFIKKRGKRINSFDEWNEAIREWKQSKEAK